MPLPVLKGVIDRRVLVNYRVDPAVAEQVLPEPFRPKIVRGFAVAGICLIRVRNIRPAFLPLSLGLRSENVAHRFAVEWDENGERREGVYVPRRDTDSYLTCLAGGRLFPGVHHHARFRVQETPEKVEIEVESDDREVRISVAGTRTPVFPDSSVFRSAAEASRFFQSGVLGYSDASGSGHYEGLELRCIDWDTEPLAIGHVSSTYFEDTDLFPASSIEFDCALFMQHIRHEWHAATRLACQGTPGLQPS